VIFMEQIVLNANDFADNLKEQPHKLNPTTFVMPTAGNSWFKPLIGIMPPPAKDEKEILMEGWQQHYESLD